MAVRARGLVAVLSLAAFALPQPSNAGCAGPTVRVSPDPQRAGELVLVVGDNWASVCDDNGGTCSGCGDCSPGDIEVPAIERIVLELVPRDGEAIGLHTIEHADLTSFAEEVRLPDDLPAGRYRIRAIAMPGNYRAWDPLRIVD